MLRGNLTPSNCAKRLECGAFTAAFYRLFRLLHLVVAADSSSSSRR
jgi:hypothetical protein